MTSIYSSLNIYIFNYLIQIINKDSILYAAYNLYQLLVNT